MSHANSIDHYIEELRRVTADTSDEDQIIARVGPLAQHVVQHKDWLQPKHYETDSDQGFGVHLLHEEPDHTLAVFIVAWLPGRGTPPHDHGTWAVVAGVEGVERNIRYERLDDRSRKGFAQLSVKHDFLADPGDLVSMKTGGIHAVLNETDRVTLSLHTYGKHINHTNRSQFDLESNAQKAYLLTVE
ncbi:MAG: cysteine dioxygenase family protein [Gammaproteobacteria bacterium]|nr:cysteine dioxygenase family protein [Gammaproteobacteria bacterium]